MNLHSRAFELSRVVYRIPSKNGGKEMNAISRTVLRVYQDMRGLRRCLTGRDFLCYLGGLVVSAPQLIRSRKLDAADARMMGTEHTFDTGRGTVVIEGKLFGAAREMYAREVYFAEPECQLPASGWVIDLGANAGLFSTLAASRGLRVLAVEAQDGFRAEFEARMNRNLIADDRWEFESVFVGGGGVLSSESEWKSASHSGGGVMTTVTMGHLLTRHSVDRIGFAKIDIEGAEYDLFEDASWLEITDRIAMEVHSDFGSPDQLAQRLRSLGFTVRLRSADLRSCDSLTETGYLYAWR
jgi:FkbM family methyltransferase